MGDAKIRLADYVKTVCGKEYRGRVYAIHHDFASSGETPAWFRGQSAKWPEWTLEKRWISILCDGRGAVVFPEHAVEVIPSFNFSNPYSEEYFR